MLTFPELISMYRYVDKCVCVCTHLSYRVNLN